MLSFDHSDENFGKGIIGWNRVQGPLKISNKCG